jgi:hypothetical protein
VTRKLLEWDLIVTAVDNSPEMLARIPDDAVRVLSDIEDLRLEKTFDTVILASCLINHPVSAARRSLVETAREHLSLHGQLLIERHDPVWLETAEVGLVSEAGGMKTFVEFVQRTGSIVEMTLRFEMLDRVWRQSFCTVPLCETELEALLADVGLGSFDWYGPKRRWVRSVVG